MGIMGCFHGNNLKNGVQLFPGRVSGFKEVKASTKHFHIDSKVGDTGSAYNGKCRKRSSGGHYVANVTVKHVRLKSKKDSYRMRNEIQTTYDQLQHPNIAKPLGCCIHGAQVLIVYKDLGYRSLQYALFGAGNSLRSKVSWRVRFRICVELATVLTFLHEESGLGIHGNLKPTNVLLDQNLNVMIADLPCGQTPKDRGYMAPEGLQGLPLTVKSDVYSFGLVMLEIISGHRHATGKTIMLLNKATKYHEDGNLGDLVDANLQKFKDYKHSEAVFMLHLAMQCVSQSFDVRPSMSEIVEILQGKKEFRGRLITTPPTLPSTGNQQAIDLSADTIHSLD